MLIRLLLAVCCLAVLSLGSPLLPLASQATAARPALSSYLQEPDGLPAAVAAEAPTPYPDCPLGTTTPTGQANPSDEPEPLGAIWCFPLGGEPTTRVIDAWGGWIDDFETNVQMGQLGPVEDPRATPTGIHSGIGMDYVAFNNVPNGGGKSQHFVNNNHWMDDNAGNFSGGAMLRPNRAFHWENGKLVVEADFAAGIPCYEAHCTFGSGDEAWGEIDISMASQPQSRIVDNLYGYGQFGGYWTVGCRLHASRHITCALESPTPTGLPGTDTPPCFSAGSYRVWEISFFQSCGTSHSSGEFQPDTQQYFRLCQNNQMDMYCRDRFRMELTQTSLSVYVNGTLFLHDSGWPTQYQIPSSWINGGANTYVYFTDWQVRPSFPLYRFHWGRLAVNPHNADGSLMAPSVAPSFCLGMPQNTCAMSMPGATPPPTMMGTMQPMATTTPTPGGRICVVHRTGFDRNPTVNMEIAQGTLRAHLAHGDTLCPTSTPRPGRR